MLSRAQVLLIFTLCISTGIAKDYRLRGLNHEEEEAVNRAYQRTRALLGPDEVNFLEQILAADELIMERQQRGIVDQILSAISGVSSGLVGTGNVVGGNVAPTTNLQAQPVAAPPLPIVTAAAQTPTNVEQQRLQQQQQTMMNGVTNNDNHLFNQVSKVVTNSLTRNVTGIVDEALKIGTPAPVRDLVNGILGVAYCNGIRRLLGRC